MTSLPFEDLPDPPLLDSFDSFDKFWAVYPRKVGKIAALTAYRKALKQDSHAAIMTGLRRYLTSKPAYCDWCHPTSWLNAGRWMDEPDALCKGPNSVHTLESLTIIAAHFKQPWCERGKYPRDVLEQCVAAGLLTVEEMEAKL